MLSDVHSRLQSKRVAVSRPAKTKSEHYHSFHKLNKKITTSPKLTREKSVKPLFFINTAQFSVRMPHKSLKLKILKLHLLASEKSSNFILQGLLVVLCPLCSKTNL